MAWRCVSGTLLLCTAATASSALVGWDAYRKFDLYSLRPGDVTREFSSYDRNNLNDDGFEGTYSCLYNTTAGRCVIAEATGPGQVNDIWFTYANSSVIGVGDIQIELDGSIVVEGVVQDIVHGSLGPPFVWPLVGDVNDTSGGNVIKVPMPYQKSMKISMSTDPHFYHVMYRSFSGDADVATFDPKAQASDVVDAMLAFGVQDPKGAQYWDGASMTASCSATEELELHGNGIVDEISIRIPDIEGAYVVTDDGRAFGKGGSSSFQVCIDPNAARCSLTRRLDRTIGNQKAHVEVDGRRAGVWSPLSSQNSTWYDQQLILPSRSTNGKSAITIQNTFVSSDLDFNEFYYAAHCQSHSSSDWELTDLLNVGWNNLHDEAYHSYQITGETWQGLRQFYTYGGERKNRAQESVDMLSDIYLVLEFDGHQTVNQPIGSFFGASLGKNDVRTLLISVDSLGINGAFKSWFPMPFSNSFKLSLKQSPGNVGGTVTVSWHKDPIFKETDNWGYFSTQYRQAETKKGQLWPFLSKGGAGVAYGVTHAIRGSILPPNNTLEFLEGDFQTWYNRTTPGKFKQAALLGTGTEDFYESGWYFADAEVPPYGVVAVPYAMPLTSLTGSESEVLDCIGSCLSPMRVLIPDSLAFDNGISMNIEHGPEHNNVNADYETTAFYYAPP